LSPRALLICGGFFEDGERRGAGSFPQGAFSDRLSGFAGEADRTMWYYMQSEVAFLLVIAAVVIVVRFIINRSD
jgi:hypothetical protein